MLRLTHEQIDLLDQLLVRRVAALVSGVLAEAWPGMTERLKERWPVFVEASMLQARRHGIDDPQDLATYVSLWCIWGPSFEDKPGFEWARETLLDPRRGPALKVHQLVHRTREELGRRLQPGAPGAAAALTPQQFDAALAAVDQQVARLGAARAIFPRDAARLPIRACDVGSIDLMVAEVEGLKEYRHSQVGWQRVVVPRLELPPLHWTRAPEASVGFAVPSHALRAGPAARLNLKLQMQALCDPKVHPEVAHQSAQGRLAWKGRDTARLSLALYARAADPAAVLPGIAALSPADRQQLTIASCGLRDAGAPFGAVTVPVQVVPATQWLFELRHAAWPPILLPDPTPAAAAAVACKLEADGAPRDAAAWQRGWGELSGKLRGGLEKMFNAWARAVDPQTPRLEAALAPLVGEAGLTWGWRRTAADAVAMRAEGLLDLIACELDLRLAGEISVGGARARIGLACKGRSELRMPIAQLGDKAVVDGQDLKSVLRSWRFPFTLDIEPLATPELTTLFAAPVQAQPAGAVTGECGLRVRPDGEGMHWFFALRMEAVGVTLCCSDPILGSATLQRELLPAMTLAEWTAG